MTYTGYNGQINVHADSSSLSITREGMVAKVNFKRTEPRVIPFAAISDVHFVDATRVRNGHITIGVGGALAPELSITQAGSHIDTVLFTHKNKDTFGELAKWLTSVVEHNKATGVDYSQHSVAGGSLSRADGFAGYVADREAEKAGVAPAAAGESTPAEHPNRRFQVGQETAAAAKGEERSIGVGEWPAGGGALQPLPPEAPIGWQFATDGSFGFALDGRWVESISLPESVHAVSDRALKKRLKAGHVPRSERADRLRKLRQADDELRRQLLLRSASTDYVESLRYSARGGFVEPLVRESGVRLMESRKGARVSERTGRSNYSGGGGSVGFKGIRVGSGGGSSSSYSKSVTHAAPDELQVIDEGEVVVSLERLSFAGQQFTRTVRAGAVASARADIMAGTLTIAPATGSKTWWLLGVSPLSAYAALALAQPGMPSAAKSLKSGDVGFLEGFVRSLVGCDDEEWRSIADEIRQAVVSYSDLLPPAV